MSPTVANTAHGRPAASAAIRIAALLLAGILPAACERAAPQPMAAPEVPVATPLVRTITDWDEYTGRLAATDTVEVRARVSGYLASADFTEGALVREGQLLFVIDTRPYETALDEARAAVARARTRLDLAGRELDRARRLHQVRAISEEELDTRTHERAEAVAALAESEAGARAAALDLEFARVRAPISGRVGRKLVTVGNLVSGGDQEATLLTTIVSVDPIHVYFTADERAFLRYSRLARSGARPSSRETRNPARLQLADEARFVHQGYVDFVDNQLDPATGTMQARAVFANPDGVLTPGLFGRVQILGEGPYEALLVPDRAIGTDQAQRVVWLVGADHKVEPRPVRLGRSVGALRVVREGLQPSDRLVVNSLQRVRPGLAVTPVEATIPAPAEDELGHRSR